MITLSQAFKFCQVKDEIIYLINIKTNKPHSFYSETIRKKLDMKKIKVYKHGLKCHFDGSVDTVFYINTPDKTLLEWEYKLHY